MIEAQNYGENEKSQLLLSKKEVVKILLNTFEYLNCDKNKIDKIDKINEIDQIVDYKIDNASENTIGFLGEYFKLKIQYKTNNIFHYFIKSLPVNNYVERKLLEDSGITKKETELYRTLLKELSSYTQTKWLPKCFYLTDSLIVLEDLINDKYFHVNNNSEFDENYLKASLKSLSAMHASSIAYEVKQKKNIGLEFNEILFETSIASDNTWYLAGIRSVKAAALQHPKYQTEEYQKFISEKFLNKLESVFELLNTSSKFRNVLCHRDVWINNLLFKNENDKLNCVLIDFQICRYCPPVVDVLYCIYMNISSRKKREQIIDDCLKWYYECLSNELQLLEININDHITKFEYVNSCKEYNLWPLMYRALVATIICLPPGVLSDLRKNYPEKYKEFAVGNRDTLVLEYLNKCEKFKNSLFEAIEELMEYILV